MAKLLNEVSHTFNEYLLIPGHTSRKCVPDNVSLETPLIRFKKGQKSPLTILREVYPCRRRRLWSRCH